MGVSIALTSVIKAKISILAANKIPTKPRNSLTLQDYTFAAIIDDVCLHG